LGSEDEVPIGVWLLSFVSRKSLDEHGVSPHTAGELAFLDPDRIEIDRKNIAVISIMSYHTTRLTAR